MIACRSFEEEQFLSCDVFHHGGLADILSLRTSVQSLIIGKRYKERHLNNVVGIFAIDLWIHVHASSSRSSLRCMCIWREELELIETAEAIKTVDMAETAVVIMMMAIHQQLALILIELSSF